MMSASRLALSMVVVVVVASIVPVNSLTGPTSTVVDPRPKILATRACANMMNWPIAFDSVGFEVMAHPPGVRVVTEKHNVAHQILFQCFHLEGAVPGMQYRAVLFHRRLGIPITITFPVILRDYGIRG